MSLVSQVPWCLFAFQEELYLGSDLLCKKKKSLKASSPCTLSRFQAEEADTRRLRDIHICALASACGHVLPLRLRACCPSCPLSPSSPRLHPPRHLLPVSAQMLPPLRSLSRHLKICPWELHGTFFSSWAFLIFDPQEYPTHRKCSQNIRRMKLFVCVFYLPSKPIGCFSDESNFWYRSLLIRYFSNCFERPPSLWRAKWGLCRRV